MSTATTFRRYGIALCALTALAALLNHVVHVNPTTVALSFLILVLLVSAYWGFRLASVVAVVATATFNFFFLPPFHTFTIADPQNWLALFAFLITAMVASDLAERARREAAQANRRRTEVERLYAFSQSLLTAENASELLNQIPVLVSRTFDLAGAALLVAATDTVYRSSPGIKFDPGKLKTTFARGEPSTEDAVSYVPLRIGV